MVVFGGGHDDYFGSDVHAFDLETREWRRISDGFVTGDADDYGANAVYPDSCYPDGSPLPPHTYGYVQYDPWGNHLLLLKGQTRLGPQVEATAIPHLFSLDTLTWRRGPLLEGAHLNSGGCSTWDPGRRILWGHSGDDGGGNAFVGYAPDGPNADGTVGRWVTFRPSKLRGEANDNVMQIHWARDRIVVAVVGRDGLVAIDPNRSDAPVEEIASAGCKPRLQPHAALAYVADRDCLIYYSAVEGRRVYEVGLEEHGARWALTSDAEGRDPVGDAAALTRQPSNLSHTFGRFRVAEYSTSAVALLVRHVDAPVYAMRLREST